MGDLEDVWVAKREQYYSAPLHGVFTALQSGIIECNDHLNGKS